MKNLLFGLQIVCFGIANILLLFTVLEITNSSGLFSGLNYKAPVYNGKEEFDPALQRLNSVNSLSAYCDSLYSNRKDAGQAQYAGVVERVVRKRFYHGYSTYGFGNNYIALLGENIYKKGISSIVIPDDLLKYPYAACSQQSIVVMEVLKRKGFTTRKVGFPSVNGAAGHFCLEVYYNNSWHFIDTDMEPDLSVLAANNFPDAAVLATNKSGLVGKAYANSDVAMAKRIFTGKISYGEPGAFPAIFGKLYHQASRVFSYTLWLFFGAIFIVVRKKYLILSKKNVRINRVSFSQPHKRTSSGHYPDFASPGA